MTPCRMRTGTWTMDIKDFPTAEMVANIKKNLAARLTFCYSPAVQEQGLLLQTALQLPCREGAQPQELASPVRHHTLFCQSPSSSCHCPSPSSSLSTLPLHHLCHRPNHFRHRQHHLGLHLQVLDRPILRTAFLRHHQFDVSLTRHMLVSVNGDVYLPLMSSSSPSLSALQDFQ